jgi:hypothetical protein
MISTKAKNNNSNFFSRFIVLERKILITFWHSLFKSRLFLQNYLNNSLENYTNVFTYYSAILIHSLLLGYIISIILMDTSIVEFLFVTVTKLVYSLPLILFALSILALIIHKIRIYKNKSYYSIFKFCLYCFASWSVLILIYRCISFLLSDSYKANEITVIFGILLIISLFFYIYFLLPTRYEVFKRIIITLSLIITVPLIIGIYTSIIKYLLSIV